MPFCNPCPDCDGPAIDFGYGAGDGKCSVCHGIGNLGLTMLGNECYKCNGTGVCQTCGGSGEVEDD